MTKLYDKSYALIIGVGKLDDGSILLDYAENSINDARAIEEILENKCGFERSNISTLYKCEATKTAILDKIKEISEKTTEEDRLLIFYAGHGGSINVKEIEEGFIVPVDVQPDDNRLPKWDSVIGFCDLIKLVTENAKSKQILFLIDACFSGIACKLIGMDESTPPQQRDIVDAVIKRKSVEIFTASAKNEKIADSGNTDHSLFTQRILDFLNNVKVEEYKDTGVITARQMATRVTPYIITDSILRGKRQEPQFQRAPTDQIGEFILKQFSDEEIQAARDIPPMEFSETDELISEAGLFDLLRDARRMMTIIATSTVGYENRPLSISKVYSLIFEFLKNDKYVQSKLDEIKIKNKLMESKIIEIINTMCVNIIAFGVKERSILAAIPIGTPSKRNNVVEMTK